MRHYLPILISCLLLLAGCGQKGPLTLPEDAAGQEQAATDNTDDQENHEREEQ